VAHTFAIGFFESDHFQRLLEDSRGRDARRRSGHDLFAWICLVDHWSRIAAVGGALILYRLWETVATPLEVIAPFVAIAIIVRIIRGGISPYHRWRRLAIVIPALLVAGWITRNMFELESDQGVFRGLSRFAPCLYRSVNSVSSVGSHSSLVA